MEEIVAAGLARPRDLIYVFDPEDEGYKLIEGISNIHNGYKIHLVGGCTLTRKITDGVLIKREN